MGRTRWRWMAALLVAATAACGTLHGAGTGPPALGPGEAVGIVLARYARAKGGEASREAERVGGKEGFFGGCVAEGIRDAVPRARVLEPDETWPVLLPGVPHEEVPRGREALVEALRRSPPCGPAGGLPVRYLVVLDVETREEAAATDVGMGGDGGGGGGVLVVAADTRWDRSTRIEASVLDLATLEECGHLSASSRGDEGWIYGCGVCVIPPCVIPFPIPPIPRTVMTESSTCADVGKRLGESFAKTAGP